ncbi:hypothetical protein [Phytoactinopolyspora endophytica]|uniref:hypothetical protein n=1 Tax=Phytoactinopolyspora endophytica TaxID=1642495 RepID=UPI00101BF275|nr:hypothetical protein [Phytoactinopolyspora endophytica]
MAIPYVQECNEAMSQVYTAAGNIRDAIDAIMEFANEDTWQGGKADDWMTDLEGFVGDARTSLGDPLDDAVQECRDNAQEWQAESASAGGG